MTIIHPTAIVDEKAQIAKDVEIGPYCIIGEQVSIGAGTKLQSHVVIQGNTTIGENNEIFPFASLGQVPQDLKFEGELAELVIGDDNSIREYVTMSLGTKGGGGKTVVGNGNLFMGNSHVGHDTHVGNSCVIAQGGTLAGHVELEDNVIIGGLSAVHQFCRIGAHSIIGGVSPVVRDVLPYCMVTGNRAVLEGLNLVGLRRRGFSKEAIKALRETYKAVFEGEEGNVQSRLADMAEKHADIAEVQNWLQFAQKSERGLCTPND